MPLVRPALSGSLSGMYYLYSMPGSLLIRQTARSRLATCLPRAQPIAALSTSSVKKATAVEQQQATSSKNLTASGKVRQEVPLMTQEPKKGAMQYVLYVLPRATNHTSILATPQFPPLTSNFIKGLHLIKLPTGPVSLPCGP